MNEKQLADLVAMFKSESKDHLASINRVLLQLERNREIGEHQGLLEEIFRDAHSLKGAARAVGFTRIETIAHQMESIFGATSRGECELTPSICDVIYKGLDTIGDILEESHGIIEPEHTVEEILNRLKAIHGAPASAIAAEVPTESKVQRLVVAATLPNPEAPAVVAPAAPPAEPPQKQEVPAPVPTQKRSSAPSPRTEIALEDTIRVGLTKIEALMGQADELLVSKINAEQRLTDLKEIRSDLDQKRRDFRKHDGSRIHHRNNGNGNGSEPAVYQSLFSEFFSRLSSLEKDLTGDTLRLGLVTSNLQESIHRVRMLPFETILGGFERMMRDLSRELAKDVELQVSGAEVEIDKHVLEELRDPLMHLLRNSVDHGIEPADERAAAGKPVTGTIGLHVTHQGNMINVLVQDDGRGIDHTAVRRAAIKAASIDRAELDMMDDNQVLSLVLLPGISTSRQVTDVSGRGVGLDVVRQKMEDLNGQIEINSKLGQGTTFHLTVPISLATTRGMLARIQDEIYAIPLSAVEKVVSVRAGDIQMTEGREMITYNNLPIALSRLADTLERQFPNSILPEIFPAIIIRSGQSRVAFIIDELVGEQEMVVKSLGKQLVHVRNVSGATLLGTGRVIIILNPQELVRSSQQRKVSQPQIMPAPREDSGPMARILVVDDSITTRTLEKNILEAAGFDVVTAIDGMEALGYLRTNGCDLVVSDVQMPRMDGIELTQAIKSSDEYHNIPLILVTSLASHEDRRRGLEAGADAYITKNAFDQEDLLVTIKQLL